MRPFFFFVHVMTSFQRLSQTTINFIHKTRDHLILIQLMLQNIFKNNYCFLKTTSDDARREPVIKL